MAHSTTEPMSSQQAKSRWSGLLDHHKVPATVDLARLLQQLVKLLQSGAQNDTAGILLIDEQTRTIQGQVTDLFDQHLNMGGGMLQAALRNPASFSISRLPSGRRAEDESGAKTQMVIPFRASPQVRGALVLRSSEPNAYTQQDGEALSEFAMRASSLIENALIHQKVVQETDGEVERDLVMANEIMARLLPREAPHIPGFEVASINIPAKIVGGDLLDFVKLLDDHYGFLVADASGNGIPSALLMTGFRALFRGLLQNDINIRSVFRQVNQQLFESTAAHQFVSAFYAALDATTGRLIYVNGGNVPPLLVRPDQPTRRLDMGGPVLGVLPSASYHEDSVVLRHGDVMVCYSDGVSEAENPAGDMFGEERIIQLVESIRERSADTICNTLRDTATAFVGSALRDDATICVLKYT
jgi:phosphoserine phosphatase RsbU/P